MTYNDLDGEEIRHILEERFQKLLAEVPYLQRHITLPRVRMTLHVQLDSWADQPTPDRQTITDTVEIIDESNEDKPLVLFDSVELSDTVSAAPGKGGKPPDQVRVEHGLSIPTPVRGPIAAEDVIQSVENRRMTMQNGAVVDRTGSAPERSGATVVVQDFGVAGLAKGRLDRSEFAVGNANRRDGGPVAPPMFPKE